MIMCLKAVCALIFGGLGLAGAVWKLRSRYESSQVDTNDCFFDKECHAKVDWGKVKDLKMRFFTVLKKLKAEDDVQGVKPIMSRMHMAFLRVGMPEDRIDYILTKWVEYIYPGALDAHDMWKTIVVSGFSCENGYGKDVDGEYVYQGSTKDGRPFYRGSASPDRFLYYDKYCADDTNTPRWLLGQAPDVTREYNLNTRDGSGCNNEFAIETDSMHVPGGRQSLAWQWCGDHGDWRGKSISITYKVTKDTPAKRKDGCFERFGTDKTRCLATHGRCSWVEEEVGGKCVMPKRKDGCFERFGTDKTKCLATNGRCSWVEEEVGGKCVMPRHGDKPKSEQGGKRMDGCFARFGTDKTKCLATNGRCSWVEEEVGGKCVMPMRTEHGDKPKSEQGGKRMDGCFARFGTDKTKCLATNGRCSWVEEEVGGKCVMPMRTEHGGKLKSEQGGKREDTPAAPVNDECKQYEEYGATAMRGCRQCASVYPGRVASCWECGGKCSKHCPPGSEFDCYQLKPFASCHAACMRNATTEDAATKNAASVEYSEIQV